jgi:hypothetical protein
MTMEAWGPAIVTFGEPAAVVEALLKEGAEEE